MNRYFKRKRSSFFSTFRLKTTSHAAFFCANEVVTAVCGIKIRHGCALEGVREIVLSVDELTNSSLQNEPLMKFGALMPSLTVVNTTVLPCTDYLL